jgi:hypothetical protein
MAGDPLNNMRVGNVRLLRKLGAGAMGAVYQGYHESFGVEVAVKFLTSSSPNSRERFIREGRAAARIENEHVIRVLDAGEISGKAYLVLEFVNGRSLGEILEKQEAQDRLRAPTGRPFGSLPDAGVVAGLGVQIAHGLEAIHLKGIVHRDIKPDNILVSQTGRAKIADLGLAKQLDDPELIRLTGTGMVVGTPLYVSPEGIRNPATISGASDIYSLGATLYHLLSGRPPFEGKTAYEVMKGHLEEAFRPLREVRPDIPPWLAQIVERCLDKKPERRPTPAELATCLDERRSGPSYRKPLLIAAAVLGATVLTATAGWLLVVRSGSATPAADQPQIIIRANHPHLQVRIDQGSWQPLAGPVGVTPGNHRVEVRADQDGPLLTWSGEVQAAAGSTATVTATLKDRPVNEVSHTLRGNGMLFRDGVAWDTRPQITFKQAGRYHLGRWDGGFVWLAQSVTVDGNGVLTPELVTNPEHPQGPAWFRAFDRTGQPCSPHHLVSWWEAEHLRNERKVPEPSDWLSQSTRPEQPAVGASLALVTALSAAAQELKLGRLPTAAEAGTLSEQLGAGTALWVQERGAIQAPKATSAALVAFVPL